MRVNELSKQIGKSNKEVLEILQKNHFDVKSHSSKVTEEQAEAVRRFLAGAKRQTTASKTDTGKAETNRVEDIKKEPLQALSNTYNWIIFFPLSTDYKETTSDFLSILYTIIEICKHLFEVF